MKSEDYISSTERLRQLILQRKKFFSAAKFELNQIPDPANHFLFKNPWKIAAYFNSFFEKDKHKAKLINQEIKCSKQSIVRILKSYPEESLCIGNDIKIVILGHYKNLTFIDINVPPQIKIIKEKNLETKGPYNQDD